MQLRSLIFFVSAVITAAVLFSVPTVSAQPQSPVPDPLSFPDALDYLQYRIQYKFKKIEFLRIAVTHASYSDENNKVFSILGKYVIRISLALQALGKDLNTSPDDLNDEISEVHSQCASYGMFLQLAGVVRVSSTTNSSASHVVCGAMRAIFGAIALDNGEFAGAVNVFLALRFSYAVRWKVQYHFKNYDFLLRASTHSSYSENNNEAMIILGQSIIEATVTLRRLGDNVDLSSKDLKYYIQDEDECADNPYARSMVNKVLVSENVDPSSSSIVCGAYRAFVAAIALDKGKADAGSRWHSDPSEHSGASDDVYTW